MDLNRDLKFTFADDVNVSNHLITSFCRDETIVGELLCILLVGPFQIGETVHTSSALIENNLISDKILPYDISSHLLQVVFREIGEQRNCFHE